MAFARGIKYEISELYRARFNLGVNPFRFSGESKLIHSCRKYDWSRIDKVTALL